MLFNSIEFAIFLPIVFLIYWYINFKKLKYQNLFLLAASYVFYGFWDPRFLTLIIFSSLVDYIIGRRLFGEQNNRNRKYLLLVSLFVNLGLLAVFKYYNFFIDSFASSFSFFGYGFEASRLDVILPVGISFYTFQTLSYTIDIYRRKLEPSSDVISFFTFVSFFPQLVAGPIERASNLLPQFYKKREFNYAKAADGMRQILWGLFKKIVIADNCAKHVNDIFGSYQDHTGATLFLGAVLFAFQIYGDFSGYSDIAIGTSRLFGFNLKQNFAFPYFSRDIAEFWRRWHISLSTWFRDYVYIPLGGNKGSKTRKIFNIFVIFLVSGFWHGANWTFIVWGGLNAMLFLPLMLLDRNRKNTDTVAEGKIFSSLRELFQIGITFFATSIIWVFFRAENLSKAFDYTSLIFQKSFFTIPKLSNSYMLLDISFIPILIIFEWFTRTKQHGLEIGEIKSLYRRIIYIFLIILIFSFGEFGQHEFIYFQF
jgi:alginate O-acetyltransferase complex protein AlgI